MKDRTRTSEARRRSWREGRRAEAIAAWWLLLKGYRVLARRFKVPSGEIDLVVRRGKVIAAVEVKERASLDRAAEAIGPRQRRRVARAAQAFMQQNPAQAVCDLRFDVVLIVPGRRPRHVPDAWRPDETAT